MFSLANRRVRCAERQSFAAVSVPEGRRDAPWVARPREDVDVFRWINAEVFSFGLRAEWEFRMP